MARKPSTAKTATAVAAVSLSTVIGFGLEGGRIDAKAVGDLVDRGLIETDGNGPTEDGTILVRATEAGRAFDAGGELAEPAPVRVSGFAMVSGFQIPTKRRRAAKATVYPFDDLAVGNAFFVPATAERPEPAKSMQSTVASANARYTEPTGNKVMKKRREFAHDESGKIAIGEDGKRIVANVFEEEVDETRQVREFGVTAVEDGAEAGFGDQFSGISGAAIYRSL